MVRFTFVFGCLCSRVTSLAPTLSYLEIPATLPNASRQVGAALTSTIGFVYLYMRSHSLLFERLVCQVPPVSHQWHDITSASARMTSWHSGRAGANPLKVRRVLSRHLLTHLWASTRWLSVKESLWLPSVFNQCDPANLASYRVSGSSARDITARVIYEHSRRD